VAAYEYDAVVVGGGHNGLTAAAYLARSGLRVAVFERRPVVGGACVTEEVWPGIRVNTAAYVVSLLDPAIVRELDLVRRHGLRFLPREPSSFTPLPDGGGFLLGADLDANIRELRRFSPRDADRFAAYSAVIDRIAQVFELLARRPPIDLLAPGARALLQSFGFYRTMRSLGREHAHTAAELLLGSAGRFLDRWFDWQPLKATLATDAIIGAMAGPYSPGTGALLLHHVMGEAGGARGVWAYVQGGMGKISDALAEAARAAGAEIHTGSPVARIRCHADRVSGVVLDDGSEVRSHAVLCGCDIATLVRLVGDQTAWPPGFLDRVKALDFRSPVCKINLLCDGLPMFRGVSRNDTIGPEHRGTIHLCPSLGYIENAYLAAEAGGPSEQPVVEMTIQSALDPSLAPEGKHVVGLFTQYVPPEWANDRPSRDVLDAYARRCLAAVDAVAPGFSSRVLEIQVLGPAELQERFGLTGGNIFHGAMSPGQLYFLRPVPGWSQYRMPLRGLYLCGSSAHPGGGVTGIPGRLAALTVLADWRWLRRG